MWWPRISRPGRIDRRRRGCGAVVKRRTGNHLFAESLERRALLSVNTFDIAGTWKRGLSDPGALSGTLSVDTATGRMSAFNLLRTGGIKEGTGTTVSTGGVPRLIGGTPLPDTTYDFGSITFQGIRNGQYRIETAVRGSYSMVLTWSLPTGSLSSFTGGAVTFSFTSTAQFAVGNPGSGTLTMRAPANRAPTDIVPTPDPLTVAENGAVGTTVGTLSTVDPDAGDTHTYTLVSGAGSTDNASFQIVGNTLRTNAVFDYEANRSRTVRIRTTDQGGLWYEESFTVGVTNVNEAPTDILLSNDRIAENSPAGTVIGLVTTLDPDAGDTHTYAIIVDDADDMMFGILGNELRFLGTLEGDGLDFEGKREYTVGIRTTDRGGLWHEELFSIFVTNENEAPTLIELIPDPGFVPENSPPGTKVGTFTTVDPDAGDAHTYTFASGGTDNASFQIVGNELRTNAVFDYEANRSYTVRIRTTDRDGLWYEESFTVDVTNENEAPTDILLSSDRIAENSPVDTVIGLLSTVDPDAGDAHTYTLVAGAGSTDNASFQIVGNELRTNAVFDFEAQRSYTVRIRTTDRDGLWYEESFTVGVTDVNEAPVITSVAAVSVPENQAGVVTVTATDPDANTTLAYSIAGGADGARFTIDPRTGVLTFLSAPDFESPADVGADNVYDVTVQVSDGELTAAQAIVVTVTDVPEDPAAPPSGFLVGVDERVRRDVWAAYGDDLITRSEMIGLLRTIGAGGATADEIRGLRRIVDSRRGTAWEIQMDDPVRSLARKVVGVNGRDVSWSLPGDGDSERRMNDLVDKWFLGRAEPDPSSHSNAQGARYRAVAGDLFVGSISGEDVRQGDAADCYFLAALTGVAHTSPQHIRDLFLDNGDGTWTVGFFHPDGAGLSRDYVTVDRFLHTTTSGRPIYASFGARHDAAGNELWVALAEKAYAHWAETGAVKASTGLEGNSYRAIEWGYANHAVFHVTGAWSSVIGGVTTGLADGDKAALDSALARGHMVMIGSKGGAYDPNPGDLYPYTEAHVYFAPDGGPSQYRLIDPQADGMSRETFISWDELKTKFNTLVITGARNTSGRKEFVTLDERFIGWKPDAPFGSKAPISGSSPAPLPPAKPVAQPTKPVAQPTQQPVAQPTKPIAQPTKPVTTPTKPVTTPTKPVTTPTKPVTTPTKPVTTPTKPVATPTKPVATPTKPVITPTKPVTTPNVRSVTSIGALPARATVVPASQPITVNRVVPPVIVGPIRSVR